MLCKGESHSPISVMGISSPRLIGTQNLLNELKSFKILYMWVSHHMTTGPFFRACYTQRRIQIPLLSVYMDVNKAPDVYLLFLKKYLFFVHEANNSNNNKNPNHNSVVQSFGEGSLEPLSLKCYTFGTVFTVKEMETS